MSLDYFERYLKEYGKAVYSFCLYLTHNRADADDLYQQTFLTAMEKNEIQENENPKSYLISIAVNLKNNQKRKFLWRKKKFERVESENFDLEAIADTASNTEEQIMQAEEIRMLREAVAELPEKMRIVVLMFYMEEMSILEIAEALQIPDGTVKSRLHQAKEKLSERMKTYYEK